MLICDNTALHKIGHIFTQPPITNFTFRYQHFEFSYIKDLAEPSRNLADSTGKKTRKKEGGGGEGDDQEKEKDAKDK